VSHSAADVIAALIDPGSWEPWDTLLPHPEGDSRYHEQRRTARAASGTDEAGITGLGRIEGVAVALVVGEFGYLAGSIGHDAADRVIACYERAAQERLPVIAAPRSGGTRMQEGTPAFLRMAGLAAAAAAHRSAGLPSLVLLRGPTTGGAFATWGSLGHVTIAEPGALVGFLGPRVYQEVMGEPFPPGVQVAEHLVEHGVLDGVGELSQWREAAARVLRVWAGRLEGPPVRLAVPAHPVPDHPDPGAWVRVEATRRPDRPGAIELLQHGLTDVIQLPGTGTGERALGLVVALGRLHGRGVVVVAQDRRAQAAGDLIGPWSLRAAQRAMNIAEELHLPLVTVIDTPGAELSPAAEEGALAGEIARCLAHLSRLSTPSVSVLLGQGTGGGAIALLPCDRVVAAENAWVTPLPPEGAAAIVHRDAGLAPQMAAEQRVTAAALAGIGAVDEVVAEEGDWLPLLSQTIAAHVDEAIAAWSADGPARRTARWEAIGRPA
jgi:acetyl-CoA carboxylase carboxyl transferase subunit beta